MIENETIQVQIDFLNKQIEELENRTREQFVAAKESVAFALTAAEKAIAKAEVSTEKRFEAVNEFRATLSDQNNTFVRSVEFNVAHASLVEKVDILSNQISGTDALVRNKFSTFSTGPAFLTSAASIALVLIISMITGAIQLGTAQTHVLINTGAIERVNKELADLVPLKTRQEYNDIRIGKIEQKLEK